VKRERSAPGGKESLAVTMPHFTKGKKKDYGSGIAPLRDRARKKRTQPRKKKKGKRTDPSLRSFVHILEEGGGKEEGNRPGLPPSLNTH